MIPIYIEGSPDPINVVRSLASNTFTDYVESPIGSKYKPVKFVFEDQSAGSLRGNNCVVTVPFGNNITYFSNQGLDNRLNIKIDPTKHQPYNSMKRYVSVTGQQKFAVYASYGEQIYPSVKNIYQSKVRSRTQYKIDKIWNDVRVLRNYPLTNSQGYLPAQFINAGGTSSFNAVKQRCKPMAFRCSFNLY